MDSLYRDLVELGQKILDNRDPDQCYVRKGKVVGISKLYKTLK